MSKEKRPELELGADVGYNATDWKLQRAGWALMIVFLAAAAAGAFGSGPLSNARLGDESAPVRVEYKRLARHRTPMSMEIELNQLPPGSNRARLWIDNRYLDDVQITAITPEPERVESDGNRSIFEFNKEPAATRMRVIINLEAERAGRLRCRLGTDQPLSFQQFVYP